MENVALRGQCHTEYLLLNISQSGELTFYMVAMLNGTIKLGRFGFAATNLGDLNNDGLEGTYMYCTCVRILA